MKKIKIAVFLTVAILALTGCKQATNESESKKRSPQQQRQKKNQSSIRQLLKKTALLKREEF
ncbi:hypothetical protein AB6897_09625 [Carnobacterium divergens]|uniref:hypothetical protein n=1 Tax=Carnobacterium divergens TaxID=2748 RepID=UPI0039C94B60